MNSKVVLITGSSQGIGKATAKQFLRAGYNVVINSRSVGRLTKTAKELSQLGSVYAFAGDVTSFEDCQRLVAATIRKFGRLDILINNAGLSMEGQLHGMKPTVFRKVIEANLVGSANMSNAALPQLRRSEGQILFVSSLAGLIGLPGYSAYSASKMAITALAQSLQGELYGEGVHIGVAYLGFTENDPAKQILSADGERIRQPVRAFIQAAPVDQTAHAVMRMIQRRKLKAFIGPPGPFAAWMAWMFPRLCQWYVRKKYRQHILKQPQAGAAVRPQIVDDPGVGTSPVST